MSANQPHDLSIKLLVIGDSGVGKSCLLLRYIDDTFTSQFTSTIGIDFKVRTLEVDDKKIKCQIWDTAGQDRFRTITNVYYRDAQGILIVYDVTDSKSFEGLRYWIKNIEENAPDNVQKVLVGNKADLLDRRCVTKEEGSQFAEEHKLEFYEASAKDNFGVSEAFLDLIKQVKDRIITESVPVLNTGSGGAPHVRLHEQQNQQHHHVREESITKKPLKHQEKNCC
ncbi:Ras-related protein Rab [Acrasis kona]|uniref:Ras-related protein Rab-1 n=1 Tax=Acrasis kona TaxID=1008807 RepID=A0AAW2YU96_9EUKA